VRAKGEAGERGGGDLAAPRGPRLAAAWLLREAGRDLTAVRPIRDEIKEREHGLVKEIMGSSPGT
jgi:hypothetical protein